MNDLSYRKKILFITISFIIVAFGQPAWVPALGLPAAICGYAIFWRAMLSLPEKKVRFWVATGWFMAVQLVQLSWFLSHPFYYIYAVWIFFSAAVGLQFGLLSLLVNPGLKEVEEVGISRLLLIAACWTLMEWSRLFFLSGYSWNPVGLAFGGSIYSLQLASVLGVYGLSFLVIFTNLLALKVWARNFPFVSTTLLLVCGTVPFLFGIIHYTYHSNQIGKQAHHPTPQFSVVLVQTSFPVEESMKFKDFRELSAFVQNEWKHILAITRKQLGKSIDLMAIPELVVPFGTYSFLYKYDDVKRVFLETFGADVVEKLPSPELPLFYELESENGKIGMVNNAFWAQSLANIFNANVVIGLEDAEDVDGEREYYSAAIHLVPETRRNKSHFEAGRYVKRVLVPMGEYIPFSFCRDLAAQYGVFGSFTAGKNSEVWKCGENTFGVSICYEEMFGDMMKENRQKGANFLLNITSDAWFPHSKLIRQHLEHSRLRAVENGFPLVRACNTGITCVVDALGRDIAVLGDKDSVREDLSDSLYATFPLYHYKTLYTQFGDTLILGFSFILLLFIGYPNKLK